MCADANAPLPLASGSATLAVCNDAVHYVWGKRLLAAEMMRVAGAKGWVAWTHVHSALGDNATAGNTLTPAGYAALFDERRVLAARDEMLVEAAVAGRALPWSGVSAAALEDAPALALVAAPHGGDLMLPAQPPPPVGHGRVVRNPCYAETRHGDRLAWDLVLPSPEYEAEFGAVRAYAPAHLDWDAGDVADLARLARARPDLLLRLLLDTGIKKGECMALTPQHVDRTDPQAPVLVVRHRRRSDVYKERKIALDPAWLEVLDEYLAQYRPPDTIFDCTARNLEYILADVAEAAGVTTRVSFETLRWTCGVREYERGVDLDDLREKFGLSRISWRETSDKIQRLSVLRRERETAR